MGASYPYPARSPIRFGPFELDLHAGLLRKNGVRIRCQEQPLQVLAVLAERPGELVSREELRRRVWQQDTFVDFDHALNTAIKKIRAALNDDADAPRYIETVPRRGYRFIAEVQAEALPPKVHGGQNLTPEGGTVVPVTSGVSHMADYLTGYSESTKRLYSWILALAAVVALTIGAGYYFNAHRARASVNAPPHRLMIAVLPFQNMTNDEAQEVFSDGVTEETITRLGWLNSQKLCVIARTSAMKYKHAQKSVDEIGRELHADYILEGSVRREGPRVRIAAQLIHAPDQFTSWSQEFDYDSAESLNIESDAAAKIVHRVNALLGESGSPHHSLEEDAYDSRWRTLGQAGIHTEEGLQLIISSLEEGTKEDPHCAQPYASLAHVYERGANLGFLRPKLAYAKAREAAERAIQLDPNLPEAHVYMADALVTVDYDWKGAAVEIRQALALNSSDPMPHEWNGVFLAVQGKIAEAIAETNRAIELDPLNAERLTTLGGLLMCAKRNGEAEKALNSAIELDPASDMAHCVLHELYEREGRQQEAVAEWSTILSLRGQREQAVTLKNIFQKSGYGAANRFYLGENLEYFTRLSRTRYVGPLTFAWIYLHLGDKEHALLWIEKAYQERDVALPCLGMNQDNYLAALKDDPRFQAIMKKVGLPVTVGN